jgi:hypothetical protein
MWPYSTSGDFRGANVTFLARKPLARSEKIRPLI